MEKTRRACLALLVATSASIGCSSNHDASKLQPAAASTRDATAMAGASAPRMSADGPQPNAAESSTAPDSRAPADEPASAAAHTNTAADTGTAGSATPDTSGDTAAPAAPKKDADAAQPTAGNEPAQAAPRTRRAVVTDFLNQTLSIVDVDKLTEGAKREDALLGSVDMGKYVPGPLTVSVTPDGKTALVSVSGGWLRLLPSGTDIPAGAGMLVFVDLTTLQVIGELDVGTDPLGIAITQDGKHAFVGLMSESYMAYVDIEKQSYEAIQTGNQWNEELALSDDGTTGVLSTGTAGDSMTFSVDSPMTHGQTVGLTGDAGGVAFFPGSLFAFVVQAPTDLNGRTGGYNVLDASDPSAPKATDNVRTSNDPGQAYPVTAVPGRQTVVYPSSDMNSKKLTLTEMALQDGKAQKKQALELPEPATFMYGLTSNTDGVVLGAVGSEHFLVVADLNAQKIYSVPWGVSKTGPMDVKYIP